MQDLLISKQNHKWAGGGESMKNSIVKGQTESTDQQQTKWEIKCLRIWKESVSHPSSQITRMLSHLVIISISSPGVCRIHDPPRGIFSWQNSAHLSSALIPARTHAFPMASTNTSLSQQVEGSGAGAKSTTTSDNGKDELPFPKAVSKAVPSITFWEWPIWNSRKQCQATTSSLEH